MKIAVLIPYRPGTDRDKNMFVTAAQWNNWYVYCSNSDGDLFNRAQAINRAARRAADADVYVIHDCDILLADQQQAADAALIAHSETSYVVAFTKLRVLGWEATQAVHAGADVKEQPVLETVPLVWGNCFAVSRTLFDRVGGFDERFQGWGCEDIAFLNACSTLGNKHRVRGDAYHLRHPEPVKDHRHITDNHALGGRYARADGDAEAMRKIMAER